MNLVWFDVFAAIIRGNPSPDVNGHLFAAEDQKDGVVDVLAKLVCDREESNQVRTKAAFLLNCLVSNHDVRDHLFKNNEKQFQELKENNEDIK